MQEDRPRRRRSVQACVNVALVVTSVITGVLLSELSLRLVGYMPPVELYGPSIPRFYFEADPVNGYDIAKNFPGGPFQFPDYIRSYGAPITISSNNLGCRDRSFDQQDGYVLLLGDSFTWGYVPLEQTWGSVLEQFIDTRVLKCGVWGYGTRQEWHKLEAVVARAGRPRLVIVGYFVENDLLDDYRYPHITVVDGYVGTMVELADAKGGIRKFYSEDEIRARQRKFLERMAAGKPKPAGFIAHAKNVLVYHSALYDRLRQSGTLRRMAARLSLADPPPPSARHLEVFHPIAEFPWLEQAWKEHLANLRQLKSAVEATGATMLVVIFPNNAQVYEYFRPQEGDFQWEYPNQRLTEFFQQEHIAFLDLLPEFQHHARRNGRPKSDSPEDLYWPTDGHPNVMGNRLAGLLIAEHLLQSSSSRLFNEGTRLSMVRKRLIELAHTPRDSRLAPSDLD